MKICLVLEGSYPYVRGGVSSWTNNYIRTFSQHEFVLWTIGAQKQKKGKFLYQLPSNVTAVHEIFLDEAYDLQVTKGRASEFSPEESEQILKVMKNEDPDWDILFKCFNKKGKNPLSFLKSEQFLYLLRELCNSKFPYVSFSDLFYTMRSIFLPLLYLLGQEVPQADMYHTTATGYSGIMGALGSWKYDKPNVTTEHGIYSREREEEILRSKWIKPYFKDLWIDFFRMICRCAYDKADMVTALFEYARDTQIELGCRPGKCVVAQNAVYFEEFSCIPAKEPDGFVDIGAIVRIASIKDIKTMIYSFAELKHNFPNVRLHILGDVDSKEYQEECLHLVAQLEVDGILFVGNTDVKKYLEKLDFTILTSISEGQPLAIIEAMAAGRPCVATDVGACRELLEGSKDDDLGMSGICVPPMHTKAIAEAMLRLCSNKELREKMGRIAKKRAQQYYNYDVMISNYKNIYENAVKKWQVSALN